MTGVPDPAERPAVSVRDAAPWFDVSAATLYRAIAEGRAPCDVIRVGTRVSIVTASARRVLGLDPPTANGNQRDDGSGPETDHVTIDHEERARDLGEG
jgi:hypothetical protein